MKGEILCGGEPFEGGFSLLFSVLFLLVNKILSFLSHFNSWFLTSCISNKLTLLSDISCYDFLNVNVT